MGLGYSTAAEPAPPPPPLPMYCRGCLPIHHGAVHGKLLQLAGECTEAHP